LLQEDSVRSIEDAIHMLNRAVEADPRLVVAWARLSEANWLRFQETRKESSRDEAKQALAKAMQLDPALPEVRYTRGRGLLAEKRYKEAREVLEPVVRETPGMDVAWANLGPAYRELGDYDKARRAIETAIKLNPGYFRHQVYLGLLLYKFGEMDRSFAAFRKATELNPASFSAWNGLATDYLAMYKFHDAETASLRSLQNDENATGFSNLGTAYYFQGKYEDAARSYRRATQLQPGKAETWGNLGDALTMLERGKEAGPAYLRALEEARRELQQLPNDPRAHSTLGLYCARTGDRECAYREIASVSAMQPDNLEVLFRSAIVYSVFGETEKALGTLERAVKLGLRKVEISNDPGFIPLHGNARYQSILDLAG
jgi:tetratricopeptide (TPR) repeat protein